MSKISELSDGGVIQGGDTLIAVRSGGNVKVTYGGSTTANIDGGTIDGTVIGGTTPAAGTFTSLTASGDVNFDSNTLFVDASANAVGIGVSTPAAPLSFGSITNDARIYLRGNTNEFAIGTNGLQTVYAGYAGHVFQTGSFGGAERFRIAADGSLSTPTLGTSNVRFGVNAGNSIIAGGNYNTVVGDQAGTAITTGDQNTAVGFNAVAANTTGIQNTATGGYALASNTTAQGNTALGFGTLYTNTTGASNTAVGLNALNLSTTASNNTAVGASALYANTEGTGNSALGKGSLSGNTTASYNTGLGENALLTNTTGASNTAVGNSALYANTTAANNTAVGTSALAANTTGTNNTAVGASAGSSITEGASNHAIGVGAASGVTSGSNNICLGYQAGDNITTGGANLMIGNSTQASSASQNFGIILGYQVTGDGSYTTIGHAADDIRTAHGSTSWATVSDERYKKDITDSTTGLSFINALRPRTFKYKTLGELPETFNAYEADSTKVFKNSNTNHGFIAQEVKAAIDADDSIKDGFKLWDDREDGSQEVAEAALIPVLVKAIQELSTQLDAALARITTLEG
jgi:trimeric autotransporter adhesin